MNDNEKKRYCEIKGINPILIDIVKGDTLQDFQVNIMNLYNFLSENIREVINEKNK